MVLAGDWIVTGVRVDQEAVGIVAYSLPPEDLHAASSAALAVLLVSAFLPPLDFFIVNVALPSIRADLKAGAGAIQLVVSGYVRRTRSF